jgi:hypothetical protein
MADVTNHITPRLLVTTRLHVVKPFFVEVAIKTSVALERTKRRRGLRI